MDLSVVSTLYKSSKTVLPFLEEMYATLRKADVDAFEVILVDDGSPDNSVDLVKEKLEEFTNLKLVQLSKNFGHHNAMRAGLEYAKGELVFLIDSDLEEQPSLLLDFAIELKNKNLDALVGIQQVRKGKWFERASGALFWWMFNKLTEIKIPANLSTVRLMKKKVAKAIVSHRETEFFFHGIAEYSGFKSAYFSFEKKSKGYSAYSIKRRVNLMLTAITSFSSKPLLYMISIGFAMSAIALVSGIVVLTRKYVLGVDFQLGWPSLVLSIWFFSGLIISMIGILGIYLAKIYMEVKQRPNTIISEIFTSNS